MAASRASILTLAAGLVATSGVYAQPINESFDAIASLPASGWLARNNSSPVGAVGWFQGNSLIFPPHLSSGYLAANYESVNTVGTISNWQLMPVRTLKNGDELRFWTRTVFPAAYADRLQVRMSLAGSSSNVGTAATDVGDFSALLLDINPTYAIKGSGAYPTGWTQMSVTVSGVPNPTSGRLAFRYFVEHGGVNGSHSDYIGIDSLEFAPGGLVTGRCCMAGTCIITSPVACTAQGGIYGGDGTVCTGFTCPPPPTGACCTPTGVCMVLSAAACSNAGGAYRGNNTTCTPAGCPQVFPYTDGPIGIQDGIGSITCGLTATASVQVAPSFPIASADVVLLIQHPWQGDLKIRLSKVGGPSVLLVDRPGVPATPYGFSANDFGSPVAPGYIRISDTGAAAYDAPAVAAPGLAEPVGTWKPESPLTAFVGVGSAGTWELNVTDCAGGEYGSIIAFVLILTPQSGPAACYANCDGSTTIPVLTANDFQCYLNLVAIQDPAANCDESTVVPLINANDFQCFLNKFATGCS